VIWTLPSSVLSADRGYVVELKGGSLGFA